MCTDANAEADVEISEALERLNTACAEYRDVWRDRQTRDRTEGLEPPGEYVEAGELAYWIVGQVAARRSECLAELFAEVEHLLAEGSDEVRMVMTIGVLEDVQFWLTQAEGHGADPDEVLQFLGPRSRETWFKLISRMATWQREKWRGRAGD